MPINSGKGTNCPYCATPRYWTDVVADYEVIKKEFPNAGMELDVGVDVGKWSERKDMLVNKVYPIRCKGCEKVYVARLGLLNREEIERKRQFYEFNPLPADQMRSGNVLPRERWGYIGYSVVDFTDAVKAIKNDFLREAVVRKIYTAGWRFIPLGGP